MQLLSIFSGSPYFYCMVNSQKEYLGSARTKFLSSEVAGGFTGVFMGMYAVDGEGKWAQFADLHWKQGAKAFEEAQL